jgi:ribosome biogenesis GTPase
VAVGDMVLFASKDTVSGTIHHILPRRSVLSRADNLSRRKEQLIAVNIDQVLISCSVVNPSLKPYLVDRYIIAALKGNMEPIVVINKIDLLSDETIDPAQREVESIIYLEFLKAYSAVGIKVISVSTATNEGLKELRDVNEKQNVGLFAAYLVLVNLPL